MLISNNLLLARIESNGLDHTINEIDPNLIEDDLIRIIVRTAQHSKEALLEELEKKVTEETPEERSDKTIA